MQRSPLGHEHDDGRVGARKDLAAAGGTVVGVAGVHALHLRSAGPAETMGDVPMGQRTGIGQEPRLARRQGRADRAQLDETLGGVVRLIALDGEEWAHSVDAEKGRVTGQRLAALRDAHQRRPRRAFLLGDKHLRDSTRSTARVRGSARRSASHTVSFRLSAARSKPRLE